MVVDLIGNETKQFFSWKSSALLLLKTKKKLNLKNVSLRNHSGHFKCSLLFYSKLHPMMMIRTFYAKLPQLINL